MDLVKNIKLLNSGADWAIWKRKIRDLLDYHDGALDVIEGKLKKPEPLNAGVAEAEIKNHKIKMELYRKANSYAKTVISSAVTDNVYEKIMDKESAYDAWEALKNHFEASSSDQLFKICTEFFAFTWSSDEDVSTHIAKLRSLWNDLNHGLQIKKENSLPEIILICKVLNILPARFDTFRSSWMLLKKEEERSVDDLVNKLCMFKRNLPEENANKGHRTSQEALHIRLEKQKQRNRPSDRRQKKDDYCHYCKRKGHWLVECRQWIADGKPGRNQRKRYASTMTITTEVNTYESNNFDWYIDNGATRHITNRRDIFTNFSRFKIPNTAGKEKFNAVGTGTVKLLSFINKEAQTIFLKDVWYVPEISKNLFSVLAAQDKNPKSKFISLPNKCWLEISNKIVVQGYREIGGTLFKANVVPLTSKVEEANTSTENSSFLQLYHKRWGHQDKKHIQQLLKKELGISVQPNNELCEPCVYGKMHRLPFGIREKAKMPGELISADICGPFEKSFGGKRFMLNIKDVYSQFRYVYFLKEKSEAKDYIKDMLVHAERIGIKIKEFLSDNGGKFNNKEVKNLFRQKGIVHRFTAPYTPQQNGSSERDNRTIVEMARTFRYSNKDINFSEALWAEFTCTAVYVLNRTGKSSEEGKTPYEIWMRRKPRIKHLRVIGSTCYIHVPSERRRKMDKKAIRGYLIGYDGDERYRVWIEEDKRVYLSRDVRFIEDSNECTKEIELPLQNIRYGESIKEKEESNEKEIAEHERQDTGEREEEDDEEETVKEHTQETEEKEDENNEEETTEDEDREIFLDNSRKRTRERKVPSYLKDYELYLAHCELNDKEPEPVTFEEAIKDIEWNKAIQEELMAHENLGTWEKTTLPPEKKAIDTKWVFKIKENGKKKARLVVKGYQESTIDQEYAPVARLTTLRMLLSIAVQNSWEIKQFDVPTAFLNGKLKSEVYIKPAKGMQSQSDCVYKLKRALYGLKESPRSWNDTFNTFAIKHGFVRCNSDFCLYKKGNNYLLLWVDDIILTGDNIKEMEQLLKLEYNVRSLGELKNFIGIQFERGRNLEISQSKQIDKILKKFNMENCKGAKTPMETNFYVNEKDEEIIDVPYRELIGSLMYIAVCTRPDIMYAVSYLSRFLDKPNIKVWSAAKRVLRYLKETKNLALIYTKDKRTGLQGYSDSDWGGDVKDRKSVTGGIIFHNSNPVSWISRKQQSVALSSTEAEYVAAAIVSAELISVKGILEEVYDRKVETKLAVDNQGALCMASSYENSKRSKHIQVKYHYIKDLVQKELITMEYIPTERNCADILTKSLPLSKFIVHRDKMSNHV